MDNDDPLRPADKLASDVDETLQWLWSLIVGLLAIAIGLVGVGVVVAFAQLLVHAIT